MERPSEVLRSSPKPRDHSISMFGRLCYQKLKREADAPQSMLDCNPWQAKFSFLFEREFEEPCLVFIFWHTGELLLKNLERKRHFSPPLKHISPGVRWKTPVCLGKALTKMPWKEIH